MFDLPAFQATLNHPRRRRRLAGGHKPGVEQLERRELLDAGLAAGLTSSAAGRLLNSLYNNLLNRAPQPSELANWQNALNAGQSLQDLAEAFLSSPEYQTDFISNSYATLLKRQAQPQEVNGWLQATQAGLSQERLTAQFLASDEFYQEHGGTPEGWLTGLYWDLFQRTPDAAGFFLWREGLQSGTTRETVAFDFVTSPEGGTQFVTASYQQFLGRAPDAAGEAAWVAALDGGLSRSQLIAGILGSPEYTLTHSASSSDLPSNPALNGSSADFTFGPAWSSVPQGSTGVSLTAYSSQAGYGWDSLSGLVVQDQGGIAGFDNTFRVDLPNGTYTVTPTLGDGTVALSNMAIWAGGVQEVSGLNTAAGQFLAPSFDVQVTNGQLELRFAALGAGNTFVVDNLDIVPTSSAGVSTDSSSVANNGTVVASSGMTTPASSADAAAGVISGAASGTLTQTSPGGGSASLTPTLSPVPGAIAAITLNTRGHPITVTINGAPASSPVNLPITLTSTVSDPNSGATAAGFRYIWTAITNNVTVASATTPSFTFTPKSAGTYSLRLTVTDKYNVTATATKTMTAVNVSLTVSPSSLPSGTADNAYSATMKATGGSGTYTFAVTSGSLPSGLSLNQSTGVVSGTPTTAGTASFTITAADRIIAGLTGSQAYTLTVNPAPSPVGNTPTFPNNVNVPPLPAPTGAVINVSTVSQLESAVANLQSGQTILIAPGTYNLTGTLFVPQGLTNIAIRGATGKASDVVIKGDAVFDTSAPYTGSAIWGSGSGISGTILFGIWLGNVQGVTIGDLTLQDYVDHAIIMNAGVQSPLIHNVVLLDTGEQLVKVNSGGTSVNNGVVEYSTIGYTVAAPNNYTNGVDLIAAQNWIIRNNVFKNISTTNSLATTGGPSSLTGPAVLAWYGTGNIQTVNNTFIDCQTEIAYGLVAGTTPDNSGGIIANNFIYRSSTVPSSDVGISVRNSPNTEVAYNTIIINGDYPNAIEYRFTTTTGVQILYNLTDAAITQRDGATATVTGNVQNAQSSWFVNESTGDLNLTSAAAGAIGKGVYLPEVPTDYNGQPRPSNGATDVGADEYQGSPASLTVSPGTLPSATVNSSYTATVSATGGSGSYTFAVTSGSLPSGLSLNTSTGVVNGTPTTASTALFTITATDSKTAGLTGNQTYTLTVNPGSLTVSPGTLPSATVNSSYTATVSATGGSGSYTFAVTSGSLPSGLTLNTSTGVVSGTPTTAGTASFTITATDSKTAGLTGNQAYTLTVNPGSLTVSPGTLPSATVNSSYTATVSATGGSGSYTFAVTSGSLPSGLSLNTGTGVVSGTPTTAGTASFTITATDSKTAGLTGNQAYTLTVNQAISIPPVVSAGANLTGKEGTALQFAGTVTGGTAPYTYAWDFGDGDKASGSLTPTYTYANSGTYTVTLTVTDAKNQVGQSTLQVTVQDVAPSVTINGAPSSTTAGTPVSLTSTVTSPSTTDMASGFSYAWSVTQNGALFHESTAPTFSFTPTTAATYVATLTVTAKDGATGTTSQTITVAGPVSGPPSVTINGAPASSPEGAVITLTSTVTSSSAANMAAGFSYSWNVTRNGAAFASAANANFNFTPKDHGTYVVTLVATAQDKTTGTASQTITVTDVAPLVSINGAPTSSPVGTAIALTSNVFSPSTADTAAGFRYAWSVTSNSTTVASGTTANFSFTPASAGTYLVALTVTDNDGSTGTASQTIAVSSVVSDPLSVSVNGAPGSSPEGAPISLTSTVTSSSAANMAAGFSYSWNVTRNGAAFASAATANFNFTPTDHGTYVVTLVATAQDKTTGTASQTITVTDVAPLVSINGAPTSSPVGTGIALTSNVFSPSAADTAAGFRFAWSVTSGGTVVATGSNASFSFTPASAATYVVALTVTDSDSATGTASQTITVTAAPPPPQSPPPPPSTGAFITTPYLKIPNFGANPNIVSATSGAWSNPSTWSLGRVPQAGDVVSINPNTTVTYDVVSTAAINTVVVQAGGSLDFRTDVSTTLTVVNLLVLEKGDLQIGTASNPVAANVTAQVVFANQPLNTTIDPEQYGNGLIGLGTVTMYGAAKSQTFVKLATEPKAGDTTLVLSQPVTGWQAGDKLVLPDTRELTTPETGSNYVSEVEQPIIASVSSDGLTVTLTSPLQYNHLGARDANGALTFLPYVGNLSRNVMIHSQSATGTRGHVLFTDHANVDVRYVGFYGLGRTTISAPDNTTFDSNGNLTRVGTNESGRYPVYFDHLFGASTPQSDGYQSTFEGNVIFCPLDPMPFRWGLAINDSHYGLVQDNVIDNWAGAGLVTESGNESFNNITHNFVVDITSYQGNPGSVWLRADDNGLNDLGAEGVGFWFRGFNNYVSDNVAADCASYGYTYFAKYINLSPIDVPLGPGDDTSVAGQFKTIDMTATPILEFSGNEAFGATPAGLTIWWLGTLSETPNNQTPVSVVKDFHVWNVHEDGYFGYQSYNLTIDGMVMRDDLSLVAAGHWSAGIEANDYFQKNFDVTNSDIQGVFAGFRPSTNSGGGTQTFENSYVSAYFDVYVDPLWTSGENSDLISPRVTIIRNDTFGTPNVPDLGGFWGSKENIEMLNALGSQNSNLIQKDQVFVYAYNGVANDNFQVYYLQQAPSYILPQSRVNPDGTLGLHGSPNAGLTNQQNWAQFGIAFAGAVSPTSNTRTGIQGFVQPL